MVTIEEIFAEAMKLADEQLAKKNVENPEKKLAESLWKMYEEFMEVGFTDYQAFKK